MPDGTVTPPETSLFVSASSLRVRLDWFNKLRWGAAAGVAGAALVVDLLVTEPLPLRALLGTAVVLLVLNLLYVLRNRRIPPTSLRTELRLVKLQMVGDLIVLTVLLHFSGGVENPLLFVYVVHVVIASLLFKGREIFTIAWLAIVLFTVAVMGEYVGLLSHHHLLSASEMTHELPYILITLASFWLVMLASAWMGASIMKHNRAIRDELVARQRELVRADEAKMEFFRFVTHEIKGPVNTAQSAVQAAVELAQGTLPEAARDMLERAVGRLEQATGIVKGLADLTRGGLLQGDGLQVCDLGELVANVVRSYAETAANAGQRIELASPAVPVTVTSNPGMLEKIVTNLVSNAVRYNRDGGLVKLTLEDRGDRVRLAVADEGIGVEPADQERIFQEFYRTDEARRRSHLGTGLGLAIVKRYVEQLGGEIRLGSVPGAGAEFVVTLPRNREKPPVGLAVDAQRGDRP